ncbi:SWI/SNF complex subunit SWI3D-like [Iris pallida]|uniref:SWI/SNF complex subunit SWI3D-like n=1 Tax=Iris pallida TaxID=29817 RepID=A0AAX6DX01_IRIPA|nr:SWI/SNF complex subunit SWI3D-like [Iris pallida]
MVARLIKINWQAHSLYMFLLKEPLPFSRHPCPSASTMAEGIALLPQILPSKSSSMNMSDSTYSSLLKSFLCTAAFLTHLVEPYAATTSTRSSLKAMSEESPDIQLATRYCFILENLPDDMKDPPTSESVVTDRDITEAPKEKDKMPTSSVSDELKALNGSDEPKASNASDEFKPLNASNELKPSNSTDGPKPSNDSYGLNLSNISDELQPSKGSDQLQPSKGSDLLQPSEGSDELKCSNGNVDSIYYLSHICYKNYTFVSFWGF